MASLQQLSQQQLELANTIERAKQTLKKEGLDIKSTINEVIMTLVRNLCIFLTLTILLCRVNPEEDGLPDLMPLKLLLFLWFAFMCKVSYGMIDGKIEQMDGLLQRDELLKRNLVDFTRIVQDSFYLYRVIGEINGGPVVALDVKFSPHIVDHGVCVSQLALLKQLVEEPSVSSNYRFTYRVLAFALSSFGILFALVLAVISDYAMEGDAHLRKEYQNFERLRPT